MFEDIDASSSPSQNNEFENSCSSYMRRAAKACSAGDNELGLHLYLAAYEKGTHGSDAPAEDAAFALRKAWVLAVQLKERSLAEYIFEKLEPLLDSNELAVCASQLQNMALEKLEEFGLSREDLQEMTDMISQDIFGMGMPGRVMKVEHLTLPSGKIPSKSEPVSDDALEQSDEGNEVSEIDSVDVAADSAQPAEPQAEDSACPQSEPSTAIKALQAATDGSTSESLKAAPQPEKAAAQPESENAVENADAHVVVSTLDNISYAELSGYQKAIQTMRNFGIGMQDDPEFQGFVDMLNARYGLDRMPAADSFLFRAPAREDAHRFMTATLGELKLPVLRMYMEENLQGAPILCVMAQADNHPRLNAARNSFEGPGVLMLEDLDLWENPVADMGDDLGGFMLSALSRGAREAISLIRSAVENPDVFVLASASDAGGIDGFFYDLLEPLTVVDIELPTDEERAEIWEEITSDHPSLAGISLAQLVAFSSGMPRYDIYMAAREAIEDAYKASLMERQYVPVSADMLFEKLAAYQPLESEEYRALEDAVVRRFREGLEGSVDDLLKG